MAKTPKKGRSRQKEAEQAEPIVKDDHERSITEWESLNHARLVSKCNQYGLLNKGNKQTLILRIHKYLNPPIEQPNLVEDNVEDNITTPPASDSSNNPQSPSQSSATVEMVPPEDHSSTLLTAPHILETIQSQAENNTNNTNDTNTNNATSLPLSTQLTDPAPPVNDSPQDVKPVNGFNRNQRSAPLLKLLVPNYVAGALIGKGGTLITEMKEKFGGNIRLSANRQVYPGTNERIIVLTGQTNEIVDLNNFIMEKVKNGISKQPVDESRRNKVKIVLTNCASGLLIGRGGATIKSIQEESKAKISISNSDAASYPGERVLTMSGGEEECTEACRLIIEKISGEVSNMKNSQLKYSEAAGIGGITASRGIGGMTANRGIGGITERHGIGGITATHGIGGITASYGIGGITANRGIGGMGSSFNNRKPESYNTYSGDQMGLSQMGLGQMDVVNQAGHSRLKAKIEITLEVPNILVGPTLGKGGDVIRDFIQRSGARFKFSDKHENAPDTVNRTLTITANEMSQAKTAYTLVSERIEQVGNRLNIF